MGGKVTVDIATFRLLFPEFKDVTKYPDGYLELQLSAAQDYISPYNGCSLNGKSRERAIYLAAAHLITLSQKTANGDMSNGLKQSATIDKVSVSYVPPPAKNQFSWWFNQTPYGSQLLALLRAKASAGIFANGSYENVLP